MHARQISEEKLLIREHKKLAYLRRKLLSDIGSADKIFVRKGGSFAEARILYERIRAIGPATFLWVELANSTHPAGSVEWVEDGFLRGYMSRFADYGNAHDLDLVCWLKLCCAVLSLTRSSAETPARYAVSQDPVYGMGTSWNFTDLCDAVEEPSVTFAGGIAQRITMARTTLRQDAVVARRIIETSLEPGSLAVFSVWMKIPEGFAGSFVDVFFADNHLGFMSLANLRTRAWQRVWTSMRVPKIGLKELVVGIRVTGCKGDTILIGPWRLEAGCVPNDWDLTFEGSEPLLDARVDLGREGEDLRADE